MPVSISGDVVVEGDDLLGDGINIAARLETLSKPGGITLSDDAYRQVRDRLGLAWQDGGEHEVKNIARPVHVWHLVLDEKTAAAMPAQSDEQLSSSGKPSIAVLPFVNMSGDPEQEYFVDGITEDIITEMSRFHSLTVVARNSSFSFKGQPTDVSQVGHKLGVRYIVEGSARKAGKRVRVTAKLVDTDSAAQIWAERYDRDMEDIFAVQDELVRAIVTTLGGRIEAANKHRAATMGGANLKAYDLSLKAQALQDRNTRHDYQAAEQCLRKAINLDPELAIAYRQLSLIKFWYWMMCWSQDRDAEFTEALETAQRALSLDDGDGMTHAHLCMLHIYQREFDQATKHIEKALRLNPNDTKALGLYANYLAAIGEPDAAIALFDDLARLDPVEAGWITRVKGITYLTAGKFEDAISELSSLEPTVNWTRGWLASALANAGHLGEAQTVLKEFLAVAGNEMANPPERTLEAWKKVWPIQYKNAADADRLFDGLCNAGLPD